VRVLNISPETIEEVTRSQEQELHRRELAYRGERPPLDVRQQTVILVDDGLATGATMRAGVAALRQRQPAKVVVAVPVAAPSTCEEFAREVDSLVCARTPEPFGAVGLWYRDFSQTTDDEVRDLLARASELTAG
jgi:predicted phosphoribosyltransferase